MSQLAPIKEINPSLEELLFGERLLNRVYNSVLASGEMSPEIREIFCSEMNLITSLINSLKK